MKKNTDKFSKDVTVIEIANYMFENPDKKVSEIVSFFVGRFRKTSRTIERYIQKARDYNDIRLQNKEKAINDVIIKSAQESAKKGIRTREYFIAKLEEDFERLGIVVSGSVYKDIDNKTGEVVGFRQADFKDEINAKARRQNIVGQLAELQGWNAPKEMNINADQPIIINKTYTTQND